MAYSKYIRQFYVLPYGVNSGQEKWPIVDDFEDESRSLYIATCTKIILNRPESENHYTFHIMIIMIHPIS